MKHLDEKYQDILLDILNNGVEKEDRTGTGTLSVFGKQFRHNMADGFPLLTTKKMAWKVMVTELLWFLRGDTNIKWLVENKCNIWNGDAYKKYADIECNPPHDHSLSKNEFIDKIKTDDKFAKNWGELGPIYGKQWRDWDGRQKRDGSYDMSLDQIANLIFQLKRNPDSRRLMVSAWNVGELSEMTLPPCHYGFQCYVREGKYLSLMWNQRSVDTFLGLPFNIASYGLLLEILAKEVGMIPDQLIGNFGDVHLYSNHIEQAREQLTRVPFKLSTLVINDEFWNPDTSFLSQIDHIQPDDFYIKKYESHARIKAPLSN
jgi:thymidylate synthase